MGSTRYSLILLLVLAAGAAAQSSDPQQLLRQAVAAQQAGDVRTAIRLYREILKTHPEAAEIHSNLGAALVRDGQVDEGIAEYRKALERMPNEAPVRMNLALAYYKLGRLPEAARELELVRQARPGELQPALLLGDCLLQMDEAGKAVDVLLPQEPRHPDDKALIYVLSMALLKTKRTAQAQVLLDRILRDGTSAEAELLMGQGEQLNQNNIGAAEHLERAVKLNPNLPGVHSLYAQALHAIGQNEAAGREFREELKLNPYDFMANMDRVLQLKQDGKLDEALVALEMAQRVRPGNSAVRFQRASIEVLQGRLEDARQLLEQLTREFPSFTEAHLLLATSYYRLKRKADGDRERETARVLQVEEQKRLEREQKPPEGQPKPETLKQNPPN
jgi:Flp pilus assembly protein TadD